MSAELTAVHYYPDGTFETIEPNLTPSEEHAMTLCFDGAREALRSGNPPVGATLLHHGKGRNWGAYTNDKTVPNALGHAETLAYMSAQPEVGTDLSECTLITTAQPCNTCTAPYAECNIGRIIFAASRDDIRETSGLMRQRRINMHDLLIDGNTDTIVIGNVEREQSLALFGLWAQRHSRR